MIQTDTSDKFIMLKGKGKPKWEPIGEINVEQLKGNSSACYI